MSILITGGAGFIGYHLCKTKLEEGKTVICVDNLHSGQSDNINLLMTYTNFSFYNINIIFPFKTITGYSGGSINAAYLASQFDNLDRAIPLLEIMWK